MRVVYLVEDKDCLLKVLRRMFLEVFCSYWVLKCLMI